MARTPSQNDALRIAVDAAMALTYVGVMATALVEEAPHEYLGLALFALVATYVTLSRRWFRSLGRGRYDAVRILELATLAGLIACLVAQMASSLVVSKHALAFLPALPGAAVARRTHMLCSYWGFVFAFAHAGLNLTGALARLGTRHARNAVTWACRVAFAAVAVFGAWSCVQLDLIAYLTGQVAFAFADFGAPLALTYARYASIAVLIAGTFHCLASFLRRQRRPDTPIRKGAQP